MVSGAADDYIKAACRVIILCDSLGFAPRRAWPAIQAMRVPQSPSTSKQHIKRRWAVYMSRCHYRPLHTPDDDNDRRLKLPCVPLQCGPYIASIVLIRLPEGHLVGVDIVHVDPVSVE